MTAAGSEERVSFHIRKDAVAAIFAGGVIFIAAGAALLPSGDTLPAVGCLLFGILTVALAAPKLRSGPILVVDRAGLDAVRLRLRLRWEEIERMKLTTQATGNWQSITYLDLWPTDNGAALTQIRSRFGPFASFFWFGGSGAIRVTIYLWTAKPVTVADEIERLSGRIVER